MAKAKDLADQFRGIKVCDEWHKFIPFCDWALASGWQKGFQLDRINNNGNYEPGNCHWATPQENSRNRRSNRMITFAGKTQCLAAWADEIGIEYCTLWARINRCRWPIERALTEPVKRRKREENDENQRRDRECGTGEFD